MSIVLYRAKACTLRQEDRERLEAYEMLLWRRMHNVTYGKILPLSYGMANIGLLRALRQEDNDMEDTRRRHHQTTSLIALYITDYSLTVLLFIPISQKAL